MKSRVAMKQWNFKLIGYPARIQVIHLADSTYFYSFWQSGNVCVKPIQKEKKAKNFTFFLTLFSFSDLELTVFSKMEDVIKILILNPQVNL